MSNLADKMDARIRDALAELCSDTYDEKVLVSGWVLVAEVVTETDGHQALVTMHDSHTPAWDAYGMLMWATDEVISMASEESDD